MQKIFYFMHIPWGWIKQRPHFLAEELSQDFYVDVYTPKVLRRKNLKEKPSKILRTIEIFKIPMERFKLIRKLNQIIVGFLFRYIYKIEEYDYVWISDLRLYPYVGNLIKKNQKLIYDCMDDVLEFDVLKKQQKELLEIEKELFKCIDIIFFSSTELKNRKVEKYSLERKYEIVYNAVDSFILSNYMYNKYDSMYEYYQLRGYKVLTYIGTVSCWFDFEIIKRSLNDFEKIVYFIVGPIEVNVNIYNHKRIKYLGSVEHKFVKSLIIKSDILIMPFIINKLIEAVDPVKLYEYISFGKKILSIKYAELRKFGTLINTYTSYDEFYLELKKLIISYNRIDFQEDFVELNNWSKRKIQIIEKMKDLI